MQVKRYPKYQNMYACTLQFHYENAINGIQSYDKNNDQARTRTFGKGDANLRNFTRGGGCESLENSDFEAKIRDVNSVSGEKLHDLKVICPASGVRTHPLSHLCTGLN